MRRTKAWRPSPAFVIAIVALVVATAGTTYAITVPKKSVGTKQLKAKAVTAKKLAAGAVTGAKLGGAIRRSVDVRVPDGGWREAKANCQPGERLLSGGTWLDPEFVADVPITTSQPGAMPSGTVILGQPTAEAIEQAWVATAVNPPGGSGEVTLHVYALCLK
jgi:hypothetical protein